MPNRAFPIAELTLLLVESLINFKCKHLAATAAPQHLVVGFSVARPRMSMVAGRVDETRRGRAPAVAVIGAGAAGLAAGRILRDEGLRVTVFEKSHYVGGVWRYDPSPEDKAPMYRSLVTNLPKETMSYFGYPYPAELPSFTTHRQVHDYLCSYAEQYDITPLIKFGCTVKSVRPVERPPAEADGTELADESERRWKGTLGTWEVTYGPEKTYSGGPQDQEGESDGADGAAVVGTATAGRTENHASSRAAVPSIVTEVFDAVCVCNGHFDVTFTPEAEGLSGFKGTTMHSRAYDRPDDAALVDKRVLCVGSMSSGTDIAREVSSVASVVHVCDRRASTSTQGGERGNVWRRPALDRFVGDNGIRFKDGTLVEVDTIVWCTGYSYSLAFLEGCNLLTPPVTKRVHPLYEQLFHVQHPSLSFIGLSQSVLPFPLYQLQANAVAAVLSGRASLPPKVERERWLLEEEKAVQERGVDPVSRGYHLLGPLQWAYWRRLLRIAGGQGMVARSPKNAVSHGGSAEKFPAAKAAVEEDMVGVEDDFLVTMRLKEAIYDDVTQYLPTFPGGPDDYRLRTYHVDPKKGTFSVSWASHKANGETPSRTLAAAAGV